MPDLLLLAACDLLYWDISPQPSLGFTENGLNKIKTHVSGSALCKVKLY